MTVNRFFELYNSIERIFQTEDIPNPPFLKIQEVDFWLGIFRRYFEK